MVIPILSPPAVYKSSGLVTFSLTPGNGRLFFVFLFLAFGCFIFFNLSHSSGSAAKSHCALNWHFVNHK